MMAKLYTVETGEHNVKPRDGKHFSWEELTDMVGGYIEMVPLPRGRILVCNEDGRSLGLPLNPLASLAVTGYVYGDDVVGDVLIADAGYFQNDTE